MIIRESRNTFIMIEQHHHASISGYLFNQLKTVFLPTEYESLEYVIYNHDCGWIPFDQVPLWNDAKKRPFSFIDFPTPLKTIIYKNGIDEVYTNDRYAALLCSEHYKRFLQHNHSRFAKKFIHDEERRQRNIINLLPHFNLQTFEEHYTFLQLFDNISLYICLNEPGISKEKEHPFFQKGISVPTNFGFDKLQLSWKSDNEIIISNNLFKQDTRIKLLYKSLSKTAITTKGIQKVYEDTPYEKKWITI